MSRKITPSDPLATLIQWVTDTRQKAALLDEDGDLLCQRLLSLHYQQSQLAVARQRPLTLGLYGHGLEAKSWLLRILTDSTDGRIMVNAQGRNIDYLSHIQSGHSAAAMAVRFTTRHLVSHKGYPITLRLFSEIALVAIFATHYHHQPGDVALSPSRLEQRMEQLASRCQPQAQPGVSAEEITRLAAVWKQLPGRKTWTIDDGTWYQIAGLLPRLGLDDRLSLYSLFWGENPELTRQWRQPAEALARLGYVQEVCTPLDLLVDAFSLPTENFLSPGALPEEHNDQSDVIVCPVLNDQVDGQVSLSVQALAMLCSEVVFSVASTPALTDVDLVDIPPWCGTETLHSTKSRFILDYFAWQTAPDLLIICNAAKSRRDILPVSHALLRWRQATQPVARSGDHLPGVAWAITPFDNRFSQQDNPDEGVQRLSGKPGVDWGTLQALDERNVTRLMTWLSDALTPVRHQQRLDDLATQYRAQVQRVLAPYTHPVSADPVQAKALSEQLVRALQRQASRHGDVIAGLLPEPQLLESESHEQAPPSVVANALFYPDLDLFAEETPAEPAPVVKERSAGSQLYQAWVRHVRQWVNQPDAQAQTGLTGDELQLLGDIVITTSHRIGLEKRLSESGSDAACFAVLGDFVAWLGYASVPLAARPLSKINKGKPIFAPVQPQAATERLAKLSDKPVHAATRYVYDWLVALWQCAQDNIGYQAPGDLTKMQRKSLTGLLAKV